MFAIFIMGKLILYIATSLNGFIARPDGNLDWLTSVPSPASGGDYGYRELLNSINTVIMGRKTYQEVLNMGIDWPYSEFITYIASRQSDLNIQSPKTYILKDNLKETVLHLKHTSDKNIWLVGGGQLITTFIEQDLLDMMILTIVPKIIEDGIPLFAHKPKETTWKLAGVQTFDTGLVNLTYEKNTLN
jgi:dihydrofolate reductase